MATAPFGLSSSISPRQQDVRLESWKEIAAYLRRTVRTVQRWEREQGLPVHRLRHNKLATIFAYPSELDRWWAERRLQIESEEGQRFADAEASSSGQVPAAVPPPTISSHAPCDELLARRRRTVVAVACVSLAVLAVAWVGGEVRLESRSAGAERLYLKGRRSWNQRTPQGFQQALAAFQHSLELDPVNARAFSGLADTYSLLEAFGIFKPEDALPKALAAARKAVELAPDLGETHTSLSFVLWETGDRQAAFQEIRRAIALNPQYSTARHWHALYLQDSGQYQDAVHEGRAARALDPESSIIGSDLAIMLRNAGRADEARALLEELALARPTFADIRVQLAEAYRLNGQYDRALEQITFAIQNGDERASTIARLGWLQAKNGIPRGALDSARRLRMMQEQGGTVPPQAMVEALTASGDFDTALRLIAGGVRQESQWVTMIPMSDVYAALVADPRWRQLAPGVQAITDRVLRDTVASRPAPEPH
jgi:tetratricopeptide (TPR) repeat protein